MKKNKRKLLSNLFWVALLILIIVPQSRQFIQVTFHKLISNINNVSIIDAEKRNTLKSYNWNLLDTTNTMHNLSNDKNKVIVVNFWATWCPPCIAEMPSLQKLYNDYNDDIRFLFVTNENNEVIKAFMDKKGFKFPVYRPVNSIPQELETKVIPRTFIINKTGEIIVNEQGAVDWYSSDVKQLLEFLIKN